MPEVNDKKVAGASYIVTFFNDIEALTWQSASYINMLAQLRQRYPQADLNKQTENQGIEDFDQNSLIASVEAMRGYVFRSYVKFVALKNEIPEFDKKATDIKKQYEEISLVAIPSKNTIEKFTITMNELFVSGIVGELLGSAGEVLRSLTKQ